MDQCAPNLPEVPTKLRKRDTSSDCLGTCGAIQSQQNLHSNLFLPVQCLNELLMSTYTASMSQNNNPRPDHTVEETSAVPSSSVHMEKKVRNPAKEKLDNSNEHDIELKVESVNNDGAPAFCAVPVSSNRSRKPAVPVRRCNPVNPWKNSHSNFFCKPKIPSAPRNSQRHEALNCRCGLPRFLKCQAGRIPFRRDCPHLHASDTKIKINENVTSLQTDQIQKREQNQ